MSYYIYYQNYQIYHLNLRKVLRISFSPPSAKTSGTEFHNRSPQPGHLGLNGVFQVVPPTIVISTEIGAPLEMAAPNQWVKLPAVKLHPTEITIVFRPTLVGW